MQHFRVQHIGVDGSLIEETVISAATPEKAVEGVTSLRLKRGQSGYRGVLRAKVYVPAPTGATLLRYYAPEEA